MLTRLTISNLVLIRHAEIELGPGLTILSGETGAGKTILAQAIGLLLGNSGDAKLVGPYAADTYVEGEFVVPAELWANPALDALAELRPDGETSLTVSRKLSADGRGRAYAWGRTISRDILAAATERLLAVSGQFEQRRLARPAYQLDLLDGYIGATQAALRNEAVAAWTAFGAARRAYEEIASDREAAELRLEGMRMLVEATDGFRPGEEDELHTELRLLSSSQELLAAIAEASELASPDDGRGAADLAAASAVALAPLAELAPELAAACQGFREAELVLRELASDISRYADSVNADPQRLAEVDQRLSQITDAKRRFREPDYERLLQRAAEARSELDTLDGDNDPLAAAERTRAAAQLAYETVADKLAKKRRKAAPKFASAVAVQLVELAMGDGEFEVELAERAPGPSGSDEASFLIRPNKGMPLAPAAQIASGGELSRIALALRIVARSTSAAPTLLFDEIDAGIGGVTAHAVATALERLAEQAQVLVITHLPQVAALADTHLRIEKTAADNALTEITVLDGSARKQELQRMAGGGEFLAELAG